MHEEQDWFATVHPLLPLVLLLARVVEGSWTNLYVDETPVVLHFEDEKLARWEVIEPIYVGGYSAPCSFGGGINICFPSMTFRTKDEIHHARGHKHHHGKHKMRHNRGHKRHHGRD